MITINEINNQVEITKTILESKEHPLSETEWSATSEYLRALLYVLGQIPPKFNKEDI
jgi:hypothetical protein